MFIPTGFTEAQVIEIITKQVKLLAPSFAYGFMSVEDVEQEAFIMAMELLEKQTYDPSRPLENYLYTHLSRRLLNMWRNRVRRSDSPCKECHDTGSCQGTGYCKKYAEWIARNNCKANLVRPLDINHLCDDYEPAVNLNDPSSVETDVEIRECLEMIDKYLPIDLRSTYLQMREGVNVTKAKRIEVEDAIKLILKDAI